MNAWTIYWILQLDAISSAFWLANLVLATAAAALTIFNGISRFDTNEFPMLCDPEARIAACKARSGVRRKVVAALVPIFLISAFLPSTKTAAAMVVIPAIANNETIRKEAGDLYALAKQALREAVTDEKPKDDTLAGEK